MACRLRVLVVDTLDRILPLKTPFCMSKLLRECCFNKGGRFAKSPGRSVDTRLLVVVFIRVGRPLRDTLLGNVE